MMNYKYLDTYLFDKMYTTGGHYFSKKASCAFTEVLGEALAYRKYCGPPIVDVEPHVLSKCARRI